MGAPKPLIVALGLRMVTVTLSPRARSFAFVTSPTPGVLAAGWTVSFVRVLGWALSCPSTVSGTGRRGGGAVPAGRIWGE